MCGQNGLRKEEKLKVTCGICEKKATWMINGTEPTCNEHLVQLLDDYDKVEIEKIKRVEDQIIVR